MKSGQIRTDILSKVPMEMLSSKSLKKHPPVFSRIRDRHFPTGDWRQFYNHND